MTAYLAGWQLFHHAGHPPTRRCEEVNGMKKIAIRKTGSIKLTTSAALYCADPCC